jgi:hypothetical protein
MDLSRRKFLALALAVGAIPLYAFYSWRWGDPTDIIVAILKRRVGYLRVEPGTFNKFAKDYMLHRKNYAHMLASLSMISLPMQFLSPYHWLKHGNGLRRLEDNVVSQYLLSTDFFDNDADEHRVVSYISYYDPYTRLCSNPFIRHLR